MKRIQVWDGPTRLFHWGLVTTVAAAFIPAGDDAWLRLHVTAGFIVLGLLLFRILWGFAGNHYARFASFIRPWHDVKTYTMTLFGPNRRRFVGHNPLVGWVMLTLIGMGILICLTGIGIYGGEEGRGPLEKALPFGLGTGLKEIHETLAGILLGMVAIHLTGILVESRLHGENLIKAMWLGYKNVDTTLTADVVLDPRRGRYGWVIAILVYIGGVAIAVVLYFLPSTPPPILFTHAAWQKECGACHMALPPSLLPKASWEKVMADLGNHFGDDATLDDATRSDITAFLTQHSAEVSHSEAAHKILATLAGKTPLRITETPYWVHKHSEIADAVYHRASVKNKINCVACHKWADRGSFEDEDIHNPR
jgi:cytochrome b